MAKATPVPPAKTAREFFIVQVRKTIQRPSRLAIIPWYLFIAPTLSKVPYLVHFIIVKGLEHIGVSIGAMPRILLQAEASYQFNLGQKFLDQNEPEESWRALEKSARYSDIPLYHTVAATCLYSGLGRMREALRCYQRSARIRRKRLAASGYHKYQDYCVLDTFWTSHIGHCAEIDYVLKLRLLEGRDLAETILYAPPGAKVANPYFSQQWKPHLRFITDSHELPFPEGCVSYLAMDHYLPGVLGPGNHYFWEVAALTYQRWASQGRGPLLRIGEDVRERGLQALVSAGMPRDAWFVGLHVRGAGFHLHHRSLHDVLNADIQDYLPAIQEITRRGGWVIRMGDPSMTPLPPLTNVLDYCHSAIRSDWMDVFLAATSRFFIGTSSGVCYVAQDYGVPCVLTNWWPPAQRPWHASDIFVPKLLRRVDDNRILALSATLEEPFGYCNSQRYLLDKHSVDVVDNDPEDIRTAVVEMLERQDGKFSYDSDDIARRTQAQRVYAMKASRLYNSPGAFGAGVLGRDFLWRHPSFLEF